MMRSALYILATLAVVALGFWAYHENYKTQASLDEVEDVQREIGQLRDRLIVLRAEWAYLNRPDRLYELAQMNYPRLELVELAPEQFGRVDQIAFPPMPSDLPFVPSEDAIDVQGELPAVTDAEDAR